MSADTRRPTGTAELLTVGQTSSAFNVHPNTVRRWARQGGLDPQHLGARGDWRFLSSDVKQLLRDA